MSSSLFLMGSVQGLFSCFSLPLRFFFCFPPASHVEGSSLTTSLRYQELRFLYQLAYGRLVIRRAVERTTLGS